MLIWGINANNHDASISVIDSWNRKIVFAGHAERYSRVKNDFHLNEGLILDALKAGEAATGNGYPSKLVWHEDPWRRKLRYLKAGQFNRLLEESPRRYLERQLAGTGILESVNKPTLHYSNHHLSHAAGGLYTSQLGNGYPSAVVVIDAIGELITASIWKAQFGKLKLVWSLPYPNSIGLFYSAVTAAVGLKPNEEEYILMGMAAYGDPTAAEKLQRLMIDKYLRAGLRFKTSLHQGIKDPVLLECAERAPYDLARAAQGVVELLISQVMRKAQELVGSNNLIYSGGVALNCLANTNIVAKMFKTIWIMPNPGDAGNSLGAAFVGAKPSGMYDWDGPFLGHDIKRELDVKGVIELLKTDGIVGVANGRAEFGPRALGNRSLLADPRRHDMKDRVNQIKKRQEFRPFAPAVLESLCDQHFEFSGFAKRHSKSNPIRSPYMQYVAQVKHPDELPAIAHIDNTARVQTVHNNTPLSEILWAWYEETGCPVLLNTSLNIKGEPLVNTWEDAQRWEATYGVKVL